MNKILEIYEKIDVDISSMGIYTWIVENDINTLSK